MPTCELRVVIRLDRSPNVDDADRFAWFDADGLATPGPSMSKHTILFLAANPSGTDQLALDRQARAIQQELERSGYRDQFELVTRWAAEPLDLLRELRKHKPTIIHFSGQGSTGASGAQRSAAPRRDVIGDSGSVADDVQDGLFFQGPDSQPQLVSTTALQATFGAAGSSVKLVVLNACYSEVQAEALVTHVDCVVGVRGWISYDGARNFAIGFYGGLAERESVFTAYKQGCAAVGLEGGSETDHPQLKVRNGVDARRLVLADPPSRQTMQNDNIPGSVHASPRTSHRTAEIVMTRDELLTRLKGLLESQFAEVLFRVGIPSEYLPSSSAPQTQRAMDAIRYLEQQGKLEQLARVLQSI
jgi:hypothetical protein